MVENNKNRNLPLLLKKENQRNRNGIIPLGFSWDTISSAGKGFFYLSHTKRHIAFVVA
jgi:hypothetical protein